VNAAAKKPRECGYCHQKVTDHNKQNCPKKAEDNRLADGGEPAPNQPEAAPAAINNEAPNIADPNVAVAGVAQAPVDAPQEQPVPDVRGDVADAEAEDDDEGDNEEPNGLPIVDDGDEVAVAEENEVVAPNDPRYQWEEQPLSIDEATIMWCGRHACRCYNPLKPHPFHLKMFSLNCSDTGYHIR
jgi:hypothetical protein